jgi:hypothetical protein
LKGRHRSSTTHRAFVGLRVALIGIALLVILVKL